MRFLRGLTVLWLLAWPAAAEESARDYFDRATAQFALGKYADAAANYEKCFELKPDPAILYNAAQAHRLAGNKSRALELYQNYVRIYRTRISNLAEVQRHIDNLRSALATDRRISTQPPITTRPPTAATETPARPRAADTPATPPKSPPRVVVAPPPPAPPPPPPPLHVDTAVVVAPAPAPKPLVKRAWFWGVVAGAVVVVGTSIALGVTLGSPGTVDPPHSFGSVQAN